jgi:hypothetical protein
MAACNLIRSAVQSRSHVRGRPLELDLCCCGTRHSQVGARLHRRCRWTTCGAETGIVGAKTQSMRPCSHEPVRICHRCCATLDLRIQEPERRSKISEHCDYEPSILTALDRGALSEELACHRAGCKPAPEAKFVWGYLHESVADESENGRCPHQRSSSGGHISKNSAALETAPLLPFGLFDFHR